LSSGGNEVSEPSFQISTCRSPSRRCSRNQFRQFGGRPGTFIRNPSNRYRCWNSLSVRTNTSLSNQISAGADSLCRK